MGQEGTKIFSVIIHLDDKSIVLDNKDVLECYFIEDIFSYCITGKLIFTDSYGMVEFGPFTGTESLTIAYGENEDIEKIFEIYKVSKISQQVDVDSTSKSVIEMYFTDVRYRALNNNRYSRSWGENVLISDIIRHISIQMVDISSFANFETTREKLDYFYMPYWPPRVAINWLMKRASGSSSRTAGYLFYQNGNGWNFITLEKLLRELPLMTVDENDDGKYVFNDSNPLLRNKILSWRISGVDNQAITKLHGGHRFGYNFSGKEMLDEEFTYAEGISRYTLLGRKSLFPDISNTHGDFILEGDSDAALLENMNYGEFIKRYSKQQCLIINVTGFEKRYAGGMIEIIWPSSLGREGIYNKNLEGKYLIKSVVHSFVTDRRPVYVQKMILIKNAYSDSENRILLNATAKNVSTKLIIGRS
jgi:hypothetical protein